MHGINDFLFVLIVCFRKDKGLVHFSKLFKLEHTLGNELFLGNLDPFLIGAVQFLTVSCSYSTDILSELILGIIRIGVVLDMEHNHRMCLNISSFLWGILLDNYHLTINYLIALHRIAIDHHSNMFAIRLACRTPNIAEHNTLSGTGF